MRSACLLIIAGVLATINPARGAAAPCRDTTAQPLQVSPAMQPYADRYNALLVADPYHLIDTDQPQWRALVADLKGNAAAPADLVARSEMMLAGSLKGDAEVAESLAVAKSALALGDAAKLRGSLHAARC